MSEATINTATPPTATAGAQSYRVLIVRTKQRRHILRPHDDAVACGAEVGPAWLRIVTMTVDEIYALSADERCSKCVTALRENTIP